jgi:signal transduction histidine kinase
MSERGAESFLRDGSQVDWSSLPARAFIAAGHELKEPLSSSRFLLTCLQNAADLTGDERQEYLEQAILLHEQMLRTIEGLIDSYRLGDASSQTLLFAREPVNLQAAAEDVAHILTPHARQYRQELHVKRSRQQYIVVANKTILNNILFQLAHSMLRANRTQSTVSIGFMSRPKQSSARIFVAGDGYMRGEAPLRHSTGRRGHASRPLSGQASSGLELFVARQLTEAIGGQFSASQRNHKQTFSAEFTVSGQLDLLGSLT